MPIIFRILTFMPQRSDLKSCTTNASLGRSHHNSSTGILERRSKVVKTQSAKDEKWKFSVFRNEIFALFNYIPDQSVVFWRGVQNLNTTNLHEYLAGKGVSNICEVSTISSPKKRICFVCISNVFFARALSKTTSSTIARWLKSFRRWTKLWGWCN